MPAASPSPAAPSPLPLSVPTGAARPSPALALAGTPGASAEGAGARSRPVPPVSAAAPLVPAEGAVGGSLPALPAPGGVASGIPAEGEGGSSNPPASPSDAPPPTSPQAAPPSPQAALPPPPAAVLSVRGVRKSFTMHLRGSVVLPVVDGVRFDVFPGECVALGGPSGAGKSSILRMIVGNYGVDAGEILLATPAGMVDLARADPRAVIALRRDVVGHVTQFLRAVPRVSAVDVVAEPLRARGTPEAEARERAAELLARLNLPRALFDLPPATFSGGERQRVNLARGFITEHPLLLLDEPTAALDGANRDVVAGMIEAKVAAGVGVLGIFHDEAMRARLATRIVDVTAFRFGAATRAGDGTPDATRAGAA